MRRFILCSSPDADPSDALTEAQTPFIRNLLQWRLSILLHTANKLLDYRLIKRWWLFFLFFVLLCRVCNFLPGNLPVQTNSPVDCVEKSILDDDNFLMTWSLDGLPLNLYGFLCEQDVFKRFACWLQASILFIVFGTRYLLKADCHSSLIVWSLAIMKIETQEATCSLLHFRIFLQVDPWTGHCWLKR